MNTNQSSLVISMYLLAKSGCRGEKTAKTVILFKLLRNIVLPSLWKDFEELKSSNSTIS